MTSPWEVLYSGRNWEDITRLDSLLYKTDNSSGFLMHSKAPILKEVELIQNLWDVFYECSRLSLFLLVMILVTWGLAIDTETCGLKLTISIILCEEWLAQTWGRLPLQYTVVVLGLACTLGALESLRNDWRLGSLLCDSDLIGLEITLGIRTCIAPLGDFFLLCRYPERQLQEKRWQRGGGVKDRRRKRGSREGAVWKLETMQTGG